MDDIYNALLKIKELTGTTFIMEPKIKKARDLVMHKTCPRCGKGTVTYIDLENNEGRNYYCNLCDWKGWLPTSLINLPEATEDMLAFTLVEFCP